MRIWKTKIIAQLAAGFLLNTAAFAEPLTLSWQNEDEWRYSFSILAAIPASTKGTSTVAGSPVPLDLDLGEALDLLDFELAGRLESWRDDFGVIVDGYHTKLSAGGAFTLPVPPAVPVSVDADIQQSAITLLLAKRLVLTNDTQIGRRFAFDLQAGARFNRLRQKITVLTPVATPVLGGTETWFEPVIAGRSQWEFNDRWSASLLADFGGFGAGGNDLQYGVTASANYRIAEDRSLRFGYAFYSIDFSTTRADGAFAYDVEQHGPFFAYTWHFQ
ncbi:MAG: hypothetical protein ACR2O1_15165 [Boseongicola sp.]